MNYFSSNVRYLRKKNKMTQTDLAKMVNKTTTTVSRWESGQRDPTVDDVMLLSRFFDVDMFDLCAVDLRIQDITGKGTFSEREMELIAAFRQLQPNEQSVIYSMILNMVKQDASL